MKVSLDGWSCTWGDCVFVLRLNLDLSSLPVRIFMPAAAESHVLCNWRSLEICRPTLTTPLFHLSDVFGCSTVLAAVIHVTVFFFLLIHSQILHVPDMSLRSLSPLRSFWSGSLSNRRFSEGDSVCPAVTLNVQITLC